MLYLYTYKPRHGTSWPLGPSCDIWYTASVIYKHYAWLGCKKVVEPVKEILLCWGHINLHKPSLIRDSRYNWYIEYFHCVCIFGKIAQKYRQHHGQTCFQEKLAAVGGQKLALSSHSRHGSCSWVAVDGAFARRSRCPEFDSCQI